MKRYYGMLEKPFKNAYLHAAKPGSTADNPAALENELDNIVYRAVLLQRVLKQSS